MKNQVSKIQENLRLGIKAARTGRNEEARLRLQAVLEEEPNQIMALFWLAFVAPEPEESTRLLERVLELDPENEQAKAGIVWVQERMGAGNIEQISEQSEPEPDSEAEQSSADPSSLRDQFLSSADAQQRAKKGALAHRARRTIDPLLLVAVMLGAVALVALVAQDKFSDLRKMGATGFSILVDRSPTGEPTLGNEQALAHQVLYTPAKEFTRRSDTILIDLDRLGEKNMAEAEPAMLPFIAGSMRAANETGSSEEIWIKSSPIEFIGPADLLPNGFRLFQPVDASLLVHQPASPDEKWIEVNVTEQRVTAWEGNVPVMSFLSSTGLPNTPTVLGEFNIYWKLEATLMAGPGYYLPDVPYTMYFYRGYALHGAYWHNNFGQPMSHGCVNLSNDNAKALFEWADPVVPAGQAQVVADANNPGTLVVVHD